MNVFTVRLQILSENLSGKLRKTLLKKAKRESGSSQIIVSYSQENRENEFITGKNIRVLIMMKKRETRIIIRETRIIIGKNLRNDPKVVIKATA